MSLSDGANWDRSCRGQGPYYRDGEHWVSAFHLTDEQIRQMRERDVEFYTSEQVARAERHQNNINRLAQYEEEVTRLPQQIRERQEVMDEEQHRRQNDNRNNDATAGNKRRHK